MKNLYAVLEGIFDEETQMDNLDNLFKFWKCSSLNKYKEMMEEFEDFTSQFPAKPNANKYDYISNDELEKDIWYIKFHSGISARQFTLFRKDDNEHILCVWGRGKVNITSTNLATSFIKSVAHPVHSTFKLPKSFNKWVNELKKYIK